MPPEPSLDTRDHGRKSLVSALLSLVIGLALTLLGYDMRQRTMDEDAWLRFSIQFARDGRLTGCSTSQRKQHAAAAGVRLDALASALHAFDFAQGVVQCRDLIREFSTYN